MKELHRARVVAIGSEEDMAAVCRTLLANCDWLEIPDDRPPYSLEELRQQVKKHAEELGGEESGFYYGMVARYTYGDADNRTCRFDIARQPSGLWTACFHYDGETPFQSEDWLYLHEHAGRVPMLAIHACADFAADKGMTVFTGGQTLDEWSQMAEIWFWLMEQYEIGNPPEEAVQHLKKLEGADDFLDLLRHVTDSISELPKEEPKTEDTKAEEPKESSDKASTIRFFSFGTLDGAIQASHLLVEMYEGCSTLYKDENEDIYILALTQSEHTTADYNRICNMLSEYGSAEPGNGASLAFLEEHCEVIAAQNAVQLLGNL